MEDLDKQAALLRARRATLVREEKKWEKKRHLRFVFSFLRRNRPLVIASVLLIISQGLIEVLLIFFGRHRLATVGLDHFGAWSVIYILIIITAFLASSFLSIKQEKTLIILFINDLRRKVFKNYLRQPLNSMNFEDKASLIAKVSYHLPLISMGASNAIFGLVRWLVYFLIILVIAWLAEINLAWVAIATTFLSVFIFGAAYFSVKRYVSREATMYSRIIKHIDDSLSEKYFLKYFFQENGVLKKFDDLVALDSVFRVRRDLWLKMGVKIMFLLLFIGAIVSQLFYDDLIWRINLLSPNWKFLYAFLAIYFSRLVYEALQIGLYFFPARLGLSLANVKLRRYLPRENRLNIEESLRFRSRKFKLFKGGSYYRWIEWKFIVGGRYLFTGGAFSGKTTLARVISGLDIFNSKSLKVKLDNRRLDYHEYQHLFSDVYFFDPEFRSEKSLLEIITGISREQADFKKIAAAMEVIRAYPKLSKIISPDGNFSLSASRIWSNTSASFALHALSCLIKKPSLVVIDNYWLDNPYEEIKEALIDLDKNLTNSIIVVFSRQDSNIINYQGKYDLEKNIG